MISTTTTTKTEAITLGTAAAAAAAAANAPADSNRDDDDVMTGDEGEAAENNTTKPPTGQREPSVWMAVAALQSLFFVFGIPVICRNHVWDRLFGSLIASHAAFGTELAVFVLLVGFAPVFFVSYSLVMLPIYAGRYPFFERYKIQQRQQQQDGDPSGWPWFDPRPEVREAFWELSRRSIRLSAFNLLVLLPVLVVPKLYADRVIFERDLAFFFSTDDAHWPSTRRIVADVLAMVTIHDLAFYAAHRAMHAHPVLYRYHRVHHEYRLNTVLAAQHFHPVDFVLGVAGPPLLATVCLPRSHSVSQFLYILWGLWVNLDDHSGYAFPWSPVRWFPGSALTDEHEFHHAANTGCYGSKLSLFNTLFGGYEEYHRYSVKMRRRRGQNNNNNTTTTMMTTMTDGPEATTRTTIHRGKKRQ